MFVYCGSHQKNPGKRNVLMVFVQLSFVQKKALNLFEINISLHFVLSYLFFLESLNIMTHHYTRCRVSEDISSHGSRSLKKVDQKQDRKEIKVSRFTISTLLFLIQLSKELSCFLFYVSNLHHMTVASSAMIDLLCQLWTSIINPTCVY